ncbi:MAG: helix-turn-helix transcriptional regulator [Clostridia bacterium]|nr:helix-turn-helix transcriptional regulator [Clostridia bacterium]
MSKNIKGYDGVLATRLRKLMSEAKITQIELAKKLGITRQSISQYMEGTMLPNAEKLYLIADFFDVSSDYLLGKTDARSYSTDIIKVCNFTGLNEEFVKYLNTSHPNKLEIINAMFNDSFIQNIVSFIEDEIALLILVKSRSKNVGGITISESVDGTVIEKIEIWHDYIENNFEEKMQEIRRKIIDRCTQNIEKVLNDIFDSWSKNTVKSMSKETFNKAMKKICAEHYLNEKAFIYRNELAKIHCESNDGQKMKEINN